MGISVLNIAFFGASVTAQKTGYVKYFTDALDIDCFNVSVHGYGSMHIRDAGICFLDNVLLENPRYCFIDWFSTAYIPQKTELIEYLDTIRTRLFLHKCAPIFLLLSGSIEHMSHSRLQMYRDVIDYCIQFHIPYINIHQHIMNHNISTVLVRDDVHTNDEGSEIYGDIIYNTFIQNKDNWINQINFNQFTATKYLNIQSIDFQLDTIYNEILIEGRGRIVGIYQSVGPFSGLVEIQTPTLTIERSIWDRWCYYERQVMNIMVDFDDYVKITVLQKEFDRSTCKGEADWSVQKVIKPIKLFYIGNIEKIDYR